MYYLTKNGILRNQKTPLTSQYAVNHNIIYSHLAPALKTNFIFLFF